MSCVAPGCKSGNGTKNIFPPGVGKHRFPKNPDLRQKWANAIPRKNWQPSKHSRICSLHFDDSDYVTDHQDSNAHRKRNHKLKVRRLKVDAVPHYFPGCPSYLSKKRALIRSETATATFRQNQIANSIELQSKNFLVSDDVIDFKSLLSNLPAEFPSSWNAIILKPEEKVIIEGVDFNEEGKPTFRFSLTIKSSLQFVMFANGCIVNSNCVKQITKIDKIERHSDVLNILAFLNSFSCQMPALIDIVEDCVQKLTSMLQQSVEQEDLLNQKLEFLVDQLSLAIVPLPSRKYSTKTLWKTLTWMKTSPALYKLLLADGLLTLPSLSRLQRLGSAFHLETGTEKKFSFTDYVYM